MMKRLKICCFFKFCFLLITARKIDNAGHCFLLLLLLILLQ